MAAPTSRIWIKNIFKSFIWLILPLCILGNIKSCSSYNEAGTHLSSYSVHVRGYYRRDGTYINSYQRRRPGGVKHDSPYEEKRFWMGSLFFICLIGGIASICIYINKNFNEIENLKEKNKELSLLKTRSSLKSNISQEINQSFYEQKTKSNTKSLNEKIDSLTIQRINVTSSNIRSVGYDLPNHILIVEFKDGRLYQYFEVPEYIYNKLLKETSKGKFFNTHISHRFRYKKL